MLKNVRLSFPSLFQRSVFNGDEGKFEATFLLDKTEHAELLKKIDKEIKKGISENLQDARIPASKLCLKDGNDQEYAGYAGCMSFKASNNKRPLLVNRDKSQLTEDDDKLYAGAYVNATVELWYQNNNYGKRVNANLLGVQFFKDGERLGGSGSSASVDDFDDFDDDEDDFLN